MKKKSSCTLKFIALGLFLALLLIIVSLIKDKEELERSKEQTIELSKKLQLETCQQTLQSLLLPKNSSSKKGKPKNSGSGIITLFGHGH